MSQPLSKIKQKLKQIKFRHLKKYLSENLKEDSRNCVHNESVESDEKGIVCVCGYEGSRYYSQICDSFYNNELAETCGLFCPKKDKDVLKKEFLSFMAESSRGQIAKEFPDVTALLWVLDLFNDGGEDTDLEEHYDDIERLKLDNKELSSKNLLLSGELTTLQEKILQLEVEEENSLVTPHPTSFLQKVFGWFR